MYINFCPATIGIQVDNFEKQSSLAARHGFGGIDFVPEYFQSEDEAKAAGTWLQKSNLEWGLFYQPSDFLSVNDHEFSCAIKQLEKTLPLVQAAGCRRKGPFRYIEIAGV